VSSGLRAEVLHNVPRSRYEITVDGRVVGFAEYRRHGDSLIFPHTEIEPSMRNRGLGAELVRTTSVSDVSQHQNGGGDGT
jgi:predicted GNAT family acetyltransferase